MLFEIRDINRTRYFLIFHRKIILIILNVLYLSFLCLRINEILGIFNQLIRIIINVRAGDVLISRTQAFLLSGEVHLDTVRLDTIAYIDQCLRKPE